jgi:hypothetical protein
VPDASSRPNVSAGAAASIPWNYTTWLNLAFLVLAALLVGRFLKTGRPAILHMMNRLTNRGPRSVDRRTNCEASAPGHRLHREMACVRELEGSLTWELRAPIPEIGWPTHEDGIPGRPFRRSEPPSPEPPRPVHYGSGPGRSVRTPPRLKRSRRRCAQFVPAPVARAIYPARAVCISWCLSASSPICTAASGADFHLGNFIRRTIRPSARPDSRPISAVRRSRRQGQVRVQPATVPTVAAGGWSEGARRAGRRSRLETFGFARVVNPALRSATRDHGF